MAAAGCSWRRPSPLSAFTGCRRPLGGGSAGPACHPAAGHAAPPGCPAWRGRGLPGWLCRGPCRRCRHQRTPPLQAQAARGRTAGRTFKTRRWPRTKRVAQHTHPLCTPEAAGSPRQPGFDQQYSQQYSHQDERHYNEHYDQHPHPASPHVHAYSPHSGAAYAATALPAQQAALLLPQQPAAQQDNRQQAEHHNPQHVEQYQQYQHQEAGEDLDSLLGMLGVS